MQNGDQVIATYQSLRLQLARGFPVHLHIHSVLFREHRQIFLAVRINLPTQIWRWMQAENPPPSP